MRDAASSGHRGAGVSQPPSFCGRSRGECRHFPAPAETDPCVQKSTTYDLVVHGPLNVAGKEREEEDTTVSRAMWRRAKLLQRDGATLLSHPDGSFLQQPSLVLIRLYKKQLDLPIHQHTRNLFQACHLPKESLRTPSFERRQRRVRKLKRHVIGLSKG